MLCNNCGNQINEGDKFCTQCGTPVPQERLCPNCQNKLADNAIFCGQCGTKVGEAPQTAPANNNPYTPPVYQQPQQTAYNQAAYSQPAYQNNSGAQYNPAGPQPQKYYMISKYVGEPTVGIAKSTGTLAVYPDHLEYTKALGNALGNMVGLAGMAIGAAKEKKENGKVEYYGYQDIQTAYVGKYMGINPAVVLVLTDGQVFSFNGTFTSQAASNIVNTILYYKGNI